VNRYRIRHRANLGHGSARLLERLLEQPDRWLGQNLGDPRARQRGATTTHPTRPRTGIRVGAAHHDGPVTVVMLVFCEFAPNLRSVHAERVALASAYAYRALLWYPWPRKQTANLIAQGFLSLFGCARDSNTDTSTLERGLRTVVAKPARSFPASPADAAVDP